MFYSCLFFCSVHASVEFFYVYYITCSRKLTKANFGNKNDGNTSRRFFDNPSLAAEITGINYDLIYRLKEILEVISSGYKINIEKFENYTTETARLYVDLYPWHPMTPTLQKSLVHGEL